MVAEGRRRMVHHEEMGGLRKGPWKAEEDEVLLNHVKRYGPRDWSSIRSKGLLQRTGKSCRLRWVNKLRPNLKNGVKFSAEEERTVIELQAQFGNKWAKIATYLSGRTDNDVKNFWSSRQKRLARILQNSAPSSSSSSKSEKNTKEVIKLPSFLDLPSHDQAHKLTKSQSCSSSSSHMSNSVTIKMPVILMPELVYPNMQCYEQNPFHQIENKPLMMEPQCNDDDLPFRCIPQLQPSDFSLPLESQEFIGETSFMDVFGQPSGAPAFVGPNGDQLLPGAVKIESSDCADNMITTTHDSFMDDYPPIDMFDHLEPLPSPSEWS